MTNEEIQMLQQRFIMVHTVLAETFSTAKDNLVGRQCTMTEECFDSLQEDDEYSKIFVDKNAVYTVNSVNNYYNGQMTVKIVSGCRLNLGLHNLVFL